MVFLFSLRRETSCSSTVATSSPTSLSSRSSRSLSSREERLRLRWMLVCLRWQLCSCCSRVWICGTTAARGPLFEG